MTYWHDWGPLLVFLCSLSLGIWIGHRQASYQARARREYDRDQVIAVILNNMWRTAWTKTAFILVWVEKAAEEIVEVHK